MKKTYIGFAGLSLLLLLGTQTVQAQQGFGTDKPNKSAAVDIQSSKRGLLIPRVDLVETTNGTTPINAPEKSLMVYNQATANDVTPGYYYWDGMKWVRFAHQSEITAINLAGDVTGPTNATVINAIQGVPVDAKNPTANQVLTFVTDAEGKNGKWVPTTLATEPWNVQGKEDKATGNTQDIYQQGKVGIGFTKDSVATKTLDVRGDFSTVSKRGDTYSGFETNLFDKDAKITTNLLYSSKSPINSMSEIGSSNEVGGIYTTNNGVVTIAKNNGNTVLSSLGAISSTHFDISVGGGYVDENKDQYSANLWGTSDQWVLSHIKKGKSAEIRVEGNKGVMFKNEGEGYIFPMKKGETNQILVTDGGISDSGKSISKLEWKNALDIITPGAEGQVLSTTGTGKDVKVEWKTPAAQKITTVSEGNGVKVTPTTESNTTDYKVAINTDGGKEGDVLTVVKDGDTNTKVEWKKPEEHKNIYTDDGRLLTNRIVDLDGKSLTFGNGNDSKMVINQTKDDFSLHVTNKKRSVLQLSSTGNNSSSNLFIFQDPDNVGQISSTGKYSGIQFNSNNDKGGGNDGFGFSINRRLRVKLDNNNTFTVGLLTLDSKDEPLLNEKKPDVKDFNSFNVKHGHVRIEEINELKGAAADKIVVADDKGVLKVIKAAMPKFFYMPSVVMPTASDQINKDLTPNVTYNNGTYTVDLYVNYISQFGEPKVTSQANFKLPVLPANELIYNITWFDPTVFTNVAVTSDGKLTYKISATADVTIGSFMNIVFAVKE